MIESLGLGGGPALAAYRAIYSCGTTGSTRTVNGPTGPLDWNCNGLATDVDVANEINYNPYLLNATSVLARLAGWNDWPNLIYQGGSIGQPALAYRLPDVTPFTETLTPQAHESIPKPWRMRMTSPGLYQRPAGTVLDLTDTYALTARSNVGWANWANVPGAVSLNPGASRQIPVRVTIPAGASGVQGNFTIQAASAAAPFAARRRCGAGYGAGVRRPGDRHRDAAARRAVAAERQAGSGDGDGAGFGRLR